VAFCAQSVVDQQKNYERLPPVDAAAVMKRKAARCRPRRSGSAAKVEAEESLYPSKVPNFFQFMKPRDNSATSIFA
jgi:hypothetical protein